MNYYPHIKHAAQTTLLPTTHKDPPSWEYLILNRYVPPFLGNLVGGLLGGSVADLLLKRNLPIQRLSAAEGKLRSGLVSSGAVTGGILGTLIALHQLRQDLRARD